MSHILPGLPLGRITTTSPIKKVFKSFSQLCKIRQKLGIISENKVVKKLKFSKNIDNKKYAPKLIFFNEKSF